MGVKFDWRTAEVQDLQLTAQKTASATQYEAVAFCVDFERPNLTIQTRATRLLFEGKRRTVGR